MCGVRRSYRRRIFGEATSFTAVVGSKRLMSASCYARREPACEARGQLAGVTKKLITYRRSDGVDLSGTLYLPPGYDAARDGTLPLVMWAYPTEYTDAALALQ